MYIINIFIALIVAIGFWKSSTKEIERKTAHASITKCALFVILTIGVLFFYYKSYQVATFRNYISVKGYKGCFEPKTNSFTLNGDTIVLQNEYSRDSLKYLVIMNSFSKDKFNYNDPFLNVINDVVKSGIRTYCAFANGEDDSTRLYLNADTVDIVKNQTNIKHCYDIDFYSNTIPSILPFKVYEENYSEGESAALSGDEQFNYISAKGVMNYDNLKVGYDYDKYLKTRYITYYGEDETKTLYLQSLNYTKTINTLNFFSAADLTQCNFEITIKSDIPVGQLGMYFDIPIEVSSMDVVSNNVTSRSFEVTHFNKKEGKVDDFKHFHIKLPTLSNLQLVRSLILTTLLTALLSLSATSIYFYGRKKYKRYKLKNKFTFSIKRKIVLLWVPIGEIILWTFLLLIAYLLAKSMQDSFININIWDIRMIKFLTVFISVLYVSFVTIVMYLLYKKGIYWRDIKFQLKKIIKDIANLAKIARRSIRYRILKYLRKKRDQQQMNK